MKSGTYLPRPGERVRVTAICPEDPDPGRRVGDVFTVDQAEPADGYGRGFLYVRARGDSVGTWCHVKPVADPVVEPVARAVESDVPVVTRDSFLAALAASEEGEDLTGFEMRAEWDLLHENAELAYEDGRMCDIDEDPS